MANVRTKRLTKGNVGAAGADVIAYTAPAGETVIIKQVIVSSQTNAIGRAQLWVSSGVTNCRLVDQAIAAKTTVLVNTWVVLLPGDQIKVRSDVQDSLEFWVSGTELEGLAD